MQCEQLPKGEVLMKTWAIVGSILFASAAQAQNLTGYWQGTLPAAKPLRTVMQVNNSDGGKRKVTLFSIDQDGEPWPADSASTAQPFRSEPGQSRASCPYIAAIPFVRSEERDCS